MTTTGSQMSSGCPFDPHAVMSREMLYGKYAELRSEGVAYSANFGGYWILSRFKDVRAALRSPEVFASGGGVRIPVMGEGRSIPLEYDPPLHTAYRRLFSERITSKSVQQMMPFLDRMIGGLVERFHDSNGGDFVADVALPMPLAVLEEVVGFSSATVAQLRELTEDSWRQLSDYGSLDEARQKLREVIRLEISGHRERPSSDYLTELLAARIDNRPITDDELERTLLTFAIAGHETTANAAGWLLYTLSRDNELQSKLRADPDLAPAVIEETLRVFTPAQLFARETTREVQVGDTQIPAGSRVLLAYASANSDEDQFPSADVLDTERASRGHLAFGFGIHQCPGAPLARAELALLLKKFVSLPFVRPAGDAVFLDTLAGGTHLGPRELPLTFGEL